MPKKGSNILALFDFDGTITSRDTLFLFLKFYKGRLVFFLNLIRLTPQFLLYKLGVIPNWRAKEILLTLFLYDEPIASFNEKCRIFTDQVLPTAIRQSAKTCILSHKNKQARIVVVTASPEYWVRPWCEKEGIECIGTKLEVKNGRIDRKSTRLNSSHVAISYAVFCLKQTNIIM